MNKNISNEKNTKKELLNIISRLKKTQILSMINNYNKDQSKMQMQNQSKMQNQNQSKTQNQNQSKMQNQNQSKMQMQNQSKRNNQKNVNMLITKKKIKIPNKLKFIEFKNRKVDNKEYNME